MILPKTHLDRLHNLVINSPPVNISSYKEARFMFDQVIRTINFLMHERACIR
jgi:hypothetical protein